MPNGHAEELKQIRSRSRFWAVIWQIGDAAYYLGILGSVIIPVVMLVTSAFNLCLKRLHRTLHSLFLALIFFLLCFPVSLGVCVALKGLERRYTGVKRNSAQ